VKNTQLPSRIVAVAAGSLLAALLSTTALIAADIIDDWATVKAPPKPELKAVMLDSKTTALLILDIGKGNCGVRPRCIATLPNIKKLHDAARAAGAMVFYTVGDPAQLADYFGVGFAPRSGEWVASCNAVKPPCQTGPDKFMGSGLDDRLKEKGIKTVIVCGTSAQGVGIGTGSGSAQRGYKVIFPVDCVSADDPYAEQYAAWHMFKGGPAVVTDATTITRTGMIKFGAS
jgi:nicotinamidase-related amidase